MRRWRSTMTRRPARQLRDLALEREGVMSSRAKSRDLHLVIPSEVEGRDPSYRRIGIPAAVPKKNSLNAEGKILSKCAVKYPPVS